MWELVKWRNAIAGKGLWNALRSLWIHSDIKTGTLIGVDAQGNKYFENKQEFSYCRDRWVEYAHYRYPKEASVIPPEWYNFLSIIPRHAWLHRMTDYPPNSVQGRRIHFITNKPTDYVWTEEQHVENLTGSPGAYRPYPTSRPKYSAWQPKQ